MKSAKETSDRMNVYLKAAEMIDSGSERFTCCAIRDATRRFYELSSTNKEATAYARMFAPSSWVYRQYGTPAGCWLDKEFAVDSNEMYEWRLTALCLASAMYETGDL